MTEGGSALGPFDWLVIFAYLIGMLAIGWWSGRRVKDTAGYQVASGRMGSLLVGLSLLGAYLSALTMMALPGKAFGPDDWLWAIQLPFLVITAIVITRFVLPWYRAAGVVSVYQFLEQRIHVVARILASLCFLALSTGRAGLTLYLPALAFSEITKTDITYSITIMGLVTIAYCVYGGIEAVIWTDAVQVIIFTLGALLSVAYILWGTSLAHGDFLGLAAQYHKFRIWQPSTKLTELTTWWLILQTLFETVRIYGTQQDMTQRYVATPSTREANKSVWISILGYIPLGFLFYFIGAALFVYYQAVGPQAVEGLKNDAIYPHFIATTLPIGVRGLVLAAIFAAAMSTISAAMNSSATVCVEDFYRRFWVKDRPDAHYLRVVRGLTLIWGLAAMGMAVMFWKLGKDAQDMWSMVMSFTTTGVLALMALAFLPIRIRPAAAVLGWLASAGAIWFMTRHTDIHFLLYPVIGNVLGFAIALVVQFILVGLRGRSPFSPDERFPLERTSATEAGTEAATG